MESASEKKKTVKYIFLILGMALLFTGCSGKQMKADGTKAEQVKEGEQATAEEEEQERIREEDLKKQEELKTQKEKEAAEKAEEKKSRPQTIVLDPGHSAVVAEGVEPLGPGSSELKAADTSGTRGAASNVPEYELTLNISLKLRNELEDRGYTVIMTRESNDVPVSCIQRADAANNAGADAYVRVHANGSEDSSAQGAMTICTTPQSPYAPELYTASRRLSDCIITKLCESAGCENDSVWETDTMSGNNWSRVPVTIVEIGYMTNPQEDMLMQTPAYQERIVQGIANGVDLFLNEDVAF